MIIIKFKYNKIISDNFIYRNSYIVFKEKLKVIDNIHNNQNKIKVIVYLLYIR